MPQDIGAEDGDTCQYIQGGKDCYMLLGSVGAEDGDRYDFNHGGKYWFMPQDSVGADDSDICEYNHGGKDWSRGYKTFLCSTLLSFKFILLINVKIPTIVIFNNS